MNVQCAASASSRSSRKARPFPPRNCNLVNCYRCTLTSGILSHIVTSPPSSPSLTQLPTCYGSFAQPAKSLPSTFSGGSLPIFVERNAPWRTYESIRMAHLHDHLHLQPSSEMKSNQISKPWAGTRTSLMVRSKDQIAL
jgi:hypothetical protein